MNEHQAESLEPLAPKTSAERREFLKLAGASLALAGASACTRQPLEKIYPYARRPENLVPGRPLYFATAMPWTSGALGLLVESHMGRPTKVEGNPDHPASLGATDVFAQASVLDLYDPQRSQVVSQAGRIRTFEAFGEALQTALAAEATRAGAGLRILTEPVTSPSLAAQLRQVLAKYPRAVWHQWESAHRDAERNGLLLAMGQDLAVRYRFDRARVIVSLAADVLGPGPGSVLAARQLTQGRQAFGPGGQRLIVLESALTLTGAKADRRVALNGPALARVAGAIALRLGVKVPNFTAGPDELALAHEIADELSAARGECVVVAGQGAPAELHALVAVVNQALGAAQKTLSYGPLPVVEPAECTTSLQQLMAALGAGSVETLIILGGNPIASAPADVDLAQAMTKVPMSVHLGLEVDETASACTWHVPMAHFLEAWGDARAFDGTESIIQPLIAPLYDGKSALELAAMLAGASSTRGYDLVRAHWSARLSKDPAAFEASWRQALHDGWVGGTSQAAQVVQASPARIDLTKLATPSSGMTLQFTTDAATYDGRFASNAWLQECPRPLTKLVWDNALHMSSADAERAGVGTGDLVQVEVGTRKLELPVWIQPGQADGVWSISLGYGREHAPAGFRAESLRSLVAPWMAPVKAWSKVGRKHALITTQEHALTEGRDLVRVLRGKDHKEEAHGAAGGAHGAHADTSMYPPFPNLTSNSKQGYAWGMSIDLDRCTGCNACVVACQSENNIPVVGKEQVAVGREMHWIRIDRYFEGQADAPEVHFQPLTCMHCEAAPCEVVCPVGATVHSDEGLNDMVYNRCVGTRYCSNNCPYKVRRFNFLLYSDFKSESKKAQRNPDVSVRSRGVMEKCTYCVQRINAARIEAKKAGRPIQDGEVTTACQQVCPAQAIQFGDINDPNSAVSKAKAREHEYALLAELNVRPRTTYGPKVKAVPASEASPH